MVAVDLSGEAYTAMRLSSGHEIGSKTVRRCIAPQSVLTCYKLLEIERRIFGSVELAAMWGYTTRSRRRSKASMDSAGSPACRTIAISSGNQTFWASLEAIRLLCRAVASWLCLPKPHLLRGSGT